MDAELQSRLEQMMATIGARFDTVEKRFDAHEARLRSLDTHLSDEFAAAKDRSATTDMVLEHLGNRLAGRFDQAEWRWRDSTAAARGDARVAIAEIRRQLAQAEARIARLEERVVRRVG